MHQLIVVTTSPWTLHIKTDYLAYYCFHTCILI